MGGAHRYALPFSSDRCRSWCPEGGDDSLTVFLIAELVVVQPESTPSFALPVSVLFSVGLNKTFLKMVLSSPLTHRRPLWVLGRRCSVVLEWCVCVFPVPTPRALHFLPWILVLGFFVANYPHFTSSLKQQLVLHVISESNGGFRCERCTQFGSRCSPRWSHSLCRGGAGRGWRVKGQAHSPVDSPEL